VLDVSGVEKRGGEFVQRSLQEAVDTDDKNRRIVDELVRCGESRRSWLVFCSGVDHAFHIRDLIAAHGIRAATVVGDTPAEERAELFAQFKAGELRALTGMNVFTTGFNAPNVDLVAMLRPTMSPGLVVQMCGRGTRLCAGKESCTVLDFAGNIRRHGPS
jgi:DNA repair protein RadD